MDLSNAFWPGSLLSPRFAPLEPRSGLRSARIRLGQWWSNAGFPWDVSLVLVGWTLGPEEGAEASAMSGLVVEVPSLLLVPRPWAKPGDLSTSAVRSSLRERRRPEVNRAVATWESFEAPTTLRDLWVSTREATRRLAVFPTSDGRPPETRERRLRQIGREAPWYFVLSEDLQVLMAEATELTGPVPTSDILLSGREWMRRTDRADADAAARGRRRRAQAAVKGEAYRPARFSALPTPEDLDLGLFELAVREAAEGMSLRQVSDALRREGERPAAAYDRHRNWRAELDEMEVRPTLVPLPRPDRDSVLSTFDAEHGWARRWLQSEDRPELLRLAFGARLDRLHWIPDRSDAERGPPGGLDRFVRDDWRFEIVPEPHESDCCVRVEWVWSGGGGPPIP